MTQILLVVLPLKHFLHARRWASIYLGLCVVSMATLSLGTAITTVQRETVSLRKVMVRA